MDVTLELYKELETIYGYKIVNKDPISKKDLNNSKKTKYGVHLGFDVELFESISERDKWLKEKKPSFAMINQYDYLGKVAGRNIVIKETSDSGKIRLIAINALDKYSYEVYNFEKSKRTGKYKWDHFMDDYSEKYRLCQELIDGLLDEELGEAKVLRK